MKRANWMGILLVIATATIASTAFGGPTVDFRDPVWAPAAGQHSYTVGGVTATAGDAFSNDVLYWDAVDGLGVISGGCYDEVDEIDWWERLDISFASATTLGGVWVSDLFDAPDGNGSDPGGENAYLVINGMTHVHFVGANSDQVNGEQFVSFGDDLSVQTIEFYAVCNNDDYSVMGVGAIPAPGAIVLSSIGVGLVGWLRRYRTF